MATAPSSVINWPDIKDTIFSTLDHPMWTADDKVLVKAFADRLTGTDHLAVVRWYLQLVKDLGTRSGMSAAAVRDAGGRLIEYLDKSAYNAVPFEKVLDPEEFIFRHQRNQRVRQRLEDWIKQIPEHLHALKSGLVLAGGVTVFDFSSALLDLVNSAVSKSQPVPAGIKVMCDAIRRGQTSITHVSHAGLFAFYWPMSSTDFADLLTAKEAVKLLRTQGVHVKERTLSSRATARPTLKQGSKYVAEELKKAAAEGFFAHGNRRP